MSDWFAPNQEDFDGSFFDPWQALGLSCLSYNSAIDEQAILVLKGIRDKLFCDDIAKKHDMSPEYVELLQSIFCGADWCEYGTSPRGCWFVHDRGEAWADDLITAWEEYYQRTWIRQER